MKKIEENNSTLNYHMNYSMYYFFFIYARLSWLAAK